MPHLHIGGYSHFSGLNAFASGLKSATIGHYCHYSLSRSEAMRTPKWLPKA